MRIDPMNNLCFCAKSKLSEMRIDQTEQTSFLMHNEGRLDIESVWNKVNKGAEIKCCSFQATMLSWHFAGNFVNNISQTKMFSILLSGLCGIMCPLNFAENAASANQLSSNCTEISEQLNYCGKSLLPHFHSLTPLTHESKLLPFSFYFFLQN